MRRYDEPIEVRRGLVAGQEAPEQFIWRDRLWVVRDVVSHWVETGAWWDQPGIAALLGVGAERSDGPGVRRAEAGRAGGAGVTAVPLGADLLAESDLWRVEAARGRVPRLRALRRRTPLTGTGDAGEDDAACVDGADDVTRGYGVFDLAFDWAEARWRLVGCAD